ncbi:MAG: M20 family metallopeptidase [Actinobacteria bacterium]|nr:M20 family metallopeptidase [Actinomycetota bacterium]
MEIETVKQQVCDRVDELAGELIDASHQIHAHPELNFEETFAHGLLTDMLERHGLAPTRHAYDIETAFDAVAGKSGPTIAVLCEYDALPGIGHACGHNIIATAGLGAGLAAAAVADAAGGRVRIMGTPAEEGGGGKVRMARAGAFDGVDAAMMVHPADADLVAMDCIAIQELIVAYEGKAAHAAAAPWDGRNALDAAVLGYMNIAALRQHIRPNERLHGIFTRAGDKPNIVPSATEMDWYVRSGTISSLQPLKQRVLACLESAATACGCTMSHQWVDNTYADMIDNGPMVQAYAINAGRLGRTVLDPVTSGRHVVGSTDMGNISYLVPSIHPMIKVAPDGVPIHSVDFARWAASAEGDLAVLDGAKAMAMTVIDLWLSPAVLAQTQAVFAERPTGVDVL